MSGNSLTLAGAAEGTGAVDAMGWSDWMADALFVDGFAGLSAPRRWRRWAVTAALPHPKWAGRWVQGWSSGLLGTSGLLSVSALLDAVSLLDAAGLLGASGLSGATCLSLRSNCFFFFALTALCAKNYWSSNV